MSELQLSKDNKSLLSEASGEIRQRLTQEIDELRTVIAKRIGAVETAVSGSGELLDTVALQIHKRALEEARVANEARQQVEAAAQLEISTLRSRLGGELEAVRSELEATRTNLETQLADTERDITVIRQKRDEHAANLEQAQQRILTLEQAVEQAARRQQLAGARLEEEVQRRTLATAQLDAARQEILVANAQAESCRLEANFAGERVSALEQRLEELEAAALARTTVLTDGHQGGLLEQSLADLITLDRARHDEILSMLIEHLNRLYRAVVVFANTPDGLRLWKSGPGLPTPRIPAIDSKSPVALAYRQQRTVVTATDASVTDSEKLWDSPVGGAIALPIVAFGRVLAVAYAENPPGQLDEVARVLHTIAETLVERVNQRLSGNSSAGESDSSPESQRLLDQPNRTPEVVASNAESGEYASPRQARRVKITSMVEILVDGVASKLIDLSAVGAQIVSATALRPNRRVRMVLPSGGTRLNCDGRVVWAQLEPSGGQAAAVYRAGVCFVEVHQPSIEAFVTQQLSGAAATPQ